MVGSYVIAGREYEIPSLILDKTDGDEVKGADICIIGSHGSYSAVYGFKMNAVFVEALVTTIPCSRGLVPAVAVACFEAFKYRGALAARSLAPAIVPCPMI
jgi:hypothetical protein